MSSQRMRKCPCKICKGKLIPQRQWRTHQDRELRIQSTSSTPYLLRSKIPKAGPVSKTFPVPLNEHRDIDEFPDLTNIPERVALDPITQEMYDHGTLNWDDDDIQLGRPVAPFGPQIKDSNTMIALIDHYERLNAAMVHGSVPYTSAIGHALPYPGWLTDAQVSESLQDMIAEAQKQDQQDQEDQEDFLDASGDLPDGPDIGDDIDIDIDPNIDSEARGLNVPLDEDDPDPFLQETETEPIPNLSDLPPHLLCIYALTTWLHLQFHLPRIACNALLSILACILAFVAPHLDPPLVTLKSVNRHLGVSVPFQVLPVCPTCNEVYPSSQKTPDLCIHCNTELFIKELTNRGNKRKERVPALKYPYLSISDQLRTILGIPGIEEALDSWRTVSRVPGLKKDIFDGNVTKNLKGPDNKPFFANNGEQDQYGPNGELRLGLVLGVDWYVYKLNKQLTADMQY